MRLRWAAFLSCFVVIVLHDWPAVFRGEFWAEDGVELFTCALSRGVPCLWQPVTGYHLFVPRLLALISNGFPVVAVPYLYGALCAVINAAIFAWFVDDGFAWLIRSAWLRLGVALLFAAGAGSGEAFLNLSNLQQGLTFLGFLILFHQPLTLGWQKLVALSLVFFSSGMAMLLAPLLLWLFYRTRGKAYLAALAVLLVSLAVNRLSSVSYSAAALYTSWANIRYVPQIYVEQLVARMFLLPWVGPTATNFLLHASNLIFWPVALLALLWGAGLLRAAKLPPADAALLGIAALSLAGYFPLIALFRAYAFNTIHRPTASVAWEARYSFLTGAFATLAWATLVSRVSDRRLVAVLAAPLVLVVLYFFPIEHHRPDVGWPGSAARIQAALDARKNGTLAAPVTIDNIRMQPHNYNDFSVTISPRP
jgi:hypothetical protein